MRTSLINKLSVVGEQYVNLAMKRSEDVRKLMGYPKALEEFKDELLMRFDRAMYHNMERYHSNSIDVKVMHLSLAWIARNGHIDSDLWDEIRWSTGIEVICGDITSAMGVFVYLFKKELLETADNTLDLRRAYIAYQERNKRLREEAGI